MKPIKRFDGELYRRSMEAIAHGALTNSKRTESFVKGVYPSHLTHGQGCYVWDTFGNRYIDFICGLGSNLLGYANEEVCEVVSRRARLGATLSLGTDLEVRVAERIKEFFPFVERVRFLKTGSDACTAASIIARAHGFDGERISVEGYHGWHPEFQELTPPHNGIFDCNCAEPYCGHGSESMPWTYDDICMVEPVMTDMSPARFEWLKCLRKKYETLIFDEVITGFRFPQWSVAQHIGVTPDLICLGKAIANGMPLSVVAGKAEYMDSDYFVSSTFAGETLSLEAALKTMELLQNKFKIELLWEKGALFLSRFNQLGEGIIQLEGYPTRSRFVGGELERALFFQEACKAGILIGPSLFFIFPHIEIMDEVLSTFADIVGRIKTGSVKLEGELPLKPYAERVRA